MRRLWLAYLLTAIGAVGIGVAVAGLPDSLPGGGSDSATAVVVAVSVVESSTTSAASTTVAGTTLAPTTTTASTTTLAPTTTTASTTTAPSTTTSTSTTAPSTTSAPPDTTTSTTVPPSPADTRVAVANGAGVPGIAGDAAELLTEAGFEDVSAINAEPVDVTTVYFVEGFEEIAVLVAVELFIDPDALADMSEVPELASDDEFDVVAVLGADIGP